MENKAHALAAGAFVVAVTALLALLAVWLMRDTTVRNLYELSTHESVSGLQLQAPVRLRGVPVGKVEKIGFDSAAPGNVLIRISVDRSAPITTSTFATVASQGVPGLGYILLDSTGPAGSPLVSSDGELPRIPLRTGGLDKLLKQSELIFDQFEQASIKLNVLLGQDNQKVLLDSVADLGQAAKSIQRVADRLEPVAAALPEVARNTSQAMQAMQSAAASVRSTSERLNAPDGPIDSLRTGGAALTTAVETFSAATLPKLGDVADETARTMRQLRRTVSAVDDNPQSLIFGNGAVPPGPGEEGFVAPGDQP